MTDYERGHLDGQIAMRERAAKAAKDRGAFYVEGDHTQEDVECKRTCDLLAERILSLQPEAGADQREAAAVPVAQQEQGQVASGVRASDAAQSASHPNAGTNATQPVAESQAPAPSEPGDRGVAPALAESRPAPNPGEQVPDSARIGGGRSPSLDPARPGPCVSVPREPKKGLLCGDVAISTDPRYAGWIFVRHVDGINWTTGAKLTPETWAMLAAAKEE